jgi:hypothetical protein
MFSLTGRRRATAGWVLAGAPPDPVLPDPVVPDPAAFTAATTAAGTATAAAAKPIKARRE